MPGSTRSNSVPAAELARNFGRWQDRAARGPVFVTNHGRPRLVLMSIDDFERISPTSPATSAIAMDPVTSLLLDRLEDGFVAFDDHEIVRRINSAAALYFRRPAEDVVGLSLHQLADPAGNAQSIGYVRRAISAGEVGTYEMPSTSYPGEIMRVQIFPFPGGGACLFRNITRQRPAAGAGAGQTALAAALESHGGVIHARLRTDGAIAQLRDSDALRLGIAPDRMAECHFVDLLAAGCRSKVRVLLEAVIQQGRARAFDGQLLLDGVRERTVRIALAPIRDDVAIDGLLLIITR